VHAWRADRHLERPGRVSGCDVRYRGTRAVPELRTQPDRGRTGRTRADSRGHLRARRDDHCRPDTREEARRAGARYHTADPEGPAGHDGRCFPRSDGVEQPAGAFDDPHPGLLSAAHERRIAARFY